MAHDYKASLPIDEKSKSATGPITKKETLISEKNLKIKMH